MQQRHISQFQIFSCVLIGFYHPVFNIFQEFFQLAEAQPKNPQNHSMHKMQLKSTKVQLSGKAQVARVRNIGQHKTKHLEAEPQNWCGDLKNFVS